MAITRSAIALSQLNINVPDLLHQDLRIAAIKEKVSLSSYVERLIQKGRWIDAMPVSNEGIQAALLCVTREVWDGGRVDNPGASYAAMQDHGE
jgi:hypothetical protein